MKENLNSTDPLLKISNLSVGFKSLEGFLLPVLRNIDLEVWRGESVGLVGESGSGKSTLALAAMGYLKGGLKVIEGHCTFSGQEMFSLSPKKLERIRGGKIALIPQNSGQSLTPTHKIGEQLSEALMLHSRLSECDHKERIVELLEQVRLPDPTEIINRYPHELSGGQQQRVAIAMALAGEPEALLLDEPTTGLDVTTQAHILELLRDIASEMGMAMVYVSHDLGAIARVCDRIAVMYAGEIILQGSARQVLLTPSHPYAQSLIASIPRLKNASLPIALDGRPPAPGSTGNGCAFVDRCYMVENHCKTSRPLLQKTQDDELVRCHYHDKMIKLPVNRQIDAIPRDVNKDKQLLSLSNLSISYTQTRTIDKLLKRPNTIARTVDGITISLAKGETLSLVGESGSGKSTILKAIAGLLSPEDGNISIIGDGNLPVNVDKRMPDQLRRIQLIFQNPDESLNPRQTIAEILAQPLSLYFGLRGEELRDRSVELLDEVRLGAHYMGRFPNQLSGGEKQRIAIARAFAAKPDLVLCDEITSALDVSVQAAVLGLLDDLRRKQGTAYIFVSHDLAVVRALSDRVAVLYQGRLCEIGPVASVYDRPAHPYTKVLLEAVLEPDPDTVPTFTAADIVELSPPAKGCPFQRRCQQKIGEICDTKTPPWQQDGAGHASRCHITRYV